MDSYFARETLWVWLTFGVKSIPSFSSSSVIGLIGLSHFSWVHFGTSLFLTVVLCQSVQGFGMSSLVVVVRRLICVQVSTSGLCSFDTFTLCVWLCSMGWPDRALSVCFFQWAVLFYAFSVLPVLFFYGPLSFVFILFSHFPFLADCVGWLLSLALASVACKEWVFFVWSETLLIANRRSSRMLVLRSFVL